MNVDKINIFSLMPTLVSVIFKSFFKHLNLYISIYSAACNCRGLAPLNPSHSSICYSIEKKNTSYAGLFKKYISCFMIVIKNFVAVLLLKIKHG